MSDSIPVQLLTAFLGDWYAIKLFFERSVSVSADSLHVIAGVFLQFLAAAVTRRPLTAWTPWLVVLAALLFNETVDLWVERWPSLAMQLGEAAKDMALTMLLPTLVMLSLRRWPNLAGSRGS